MKQPIPITAGTAVPTSSGAEDQARWDAWAWGALALAILVGLVFRALVVFAGDLPRGVNGGYYAVQVRAILRSGKLALPDFPLLFYVQTLMALVLKPFCATPARAILLATQVADTVLPCLAAVPVFMLARAWVPPARRANLPVVVLVAGLVMVANPMGLRMAGDMQKNCAALGLALLFVVYADRYLRTQRPGAALGALVALGLTGLTHLGVFGLTLLLAALLAVTAGGDSRHRRRLLLALPLAATVAVAMALLIFLFFDPTRIERLAGYLASPLRLLGQGGPGGRPGMGPGMGPGIGPGMGPGMGGPGMGGPGMGPGMGAGPGMGGPSMGPGMGVGPGMGPGGAAGMLVRPDVLPGLLLGAMGLWMWLLLLDADRAQRQVVLACSLAALGLACPWLNPDLGTRLALMAVLPGVVCIVFALAHWPRPWGCALAGGGIVLVAVAGGWRQVQAGPPGGIGTEARADLEKIATQIKDPSRTLIVARHGLEWWTAWFTGARIANNLRAALPAWDQYDQVFSLTETVSPQGFAPMGMPGMQPGVQGPAAPWPGGMMGQGPGRMPPGGTMDQGADPRALAGRPPPAGMVGQGLDPRAQAGPLPPRPGQPLPAQPLAPRPGMPPRPEAPSLRELDAMLDEPLFPPADRLPVPGPRRAGGAFAPPGGDRSAYGETPTPPGRVQGVGPVPGGRPGAPPNALPAPMEPAYRGNALLLQRFLAKPAVPPEPAEQ